MHEKVHHLRQVVNDYLQLLITCKSLHYVIASLAQTISTLNLQLLCNITPSCGLSCITIAPAQVQGYLNKSMAGNTFFRKNMQTAISFYVNRTAVDVIA